MSIQGDEWTRPQYITWGMGLYTIRKSPNIQPLFSFILGRLEELTCRECPPSVKVMTLESFLSKVAVKSDFRKEPCTCVMKTFAAFLLSK